MLQSSNKVSFQLNVYNFEGVESCLILYNNLRD